MHVKVWETDPHDDPAGPPITVAEISINRQIPPVYLCVSGADRRETQIDLIGWDTARHLIDGHGLINNSYQDREKNTEELFGQGRGATS